jgi:CubicO group peptidase (beta-lactamase class C family)
VRALCICLLVCLVLVSGLQLQPAAAAPSSLDRAALEPFLDELVEEKMEEWDIANLTLSVVADGEIVSAKGYGTADMEEGTAVDPETTLFRIGSTGKLFTWTAVMQLVEEGALDLDTDINEYLDFEIPSHLEYGQDRGETEPITLRHLMSHTPGFEDYMTEVFAISAEDLPPLEDYVREERPARVFPSGDVPAYSNYGAALAGYIVQVVSGMPYADYVEQNIYEPLGMENSSFRQPLPPNLEDDMSGAYRYVDGEFLEGGFEYMQEPAGSMSSSAADMARFMLAYLQEGELDGERILAEETVEEMFTEEFTVHPRLNGTAHGFIHTTTNGRDIFHHPGGTMLFNTAFYLIPEEETGFFVSHSGGAHPANGDIFSQFMDQYFPEEETSQPEPVVLESAEDYTGEYHQNRRSFTTVDRFLSLVFGVVQVDTDEDGFLTVSLGGESNRYSEVEPGVYEVIRENGRQDFGEDFQTIVFSTDPHGKPMLLGHGPMSYSKAAWYETFGVTIAALVLSVVFIIGSFVYWLVKAGILKMRKKKTRPARKPGAVWAKWTGALLGALTVGFVIQFLMESEPDPVYGLPESAYSPPPAWVELLDTVVSYGIVFSALAAAVFAIAAWMKSYWRLPGRIHYTLFAGAGLVLSWIFYFWQVI